MSTTNSMRLWTWELRLRATVIAAVSVLLVLATGAATRAQAPTFTVLHTFTGTPDGAEPQVGLFRDAAGNLYGTTLGGGCVVATGGCGTVFELDPTGNENVLYRFGTSAPVSPFPWGVVRDTAGNLYGTTRDGGIGLGAVFKLDTSGNFAVLHNFAFNASTNPLEGGEPFAGLVIDPAAGNLYGTTAFGGSSNCSGPAGGCGTVFKIDTAGNNYAVLHDFTGADGATPVAGLIRDTAGNLYGTTYFGGSFGAGTVFKLDTSLSVKVLHSFAGFPTDGTNPAAGLLMDAAGNLYGTTTAGGSSASSVCLSQTRVGGCGTVFKLDAAGNETVLHSFTGYPSDGAVPDAALVMDTAGNLYGTTSDGGPGPCTGSFQIVVGCGTVFKLDPAGNETILYSFTGGSDGASPLTGYLVMDTAGNLYGTASAGGFGTTNAGGPCTVGGGLGGCGTVFKLTVQAPAPTITSISPPGAIAGGPAFTLTVNGTNFVSGSTVNFNGIASTTTFVSETQLTAAVPASDIAVAGSFNVTVTNPGGGTSNAVSFTVVTPERATQTIVNSVNTLFSQGVINGGQDNSLVVQLQQAINMMSAGKNNGAIGNLDSFILEVNDLLSSGVLSPSQAASLISAAQSVIAALP